MERRFQEDTIQIDAKKIETYNHDIHGPVTVFKDVVIARAIVHKYDDGMAYKPGRELGDSYWTAEGMWSISGGHPSTAIISTRDEIHGRTVNVRFSRGLKDVKTKRPMNRGILADLEVFDNKIPPELLNDMKSGKKTEVSIGFFFDHDDTAGTVDDEEDQALKGTAYDYVQRNITINHVAFGLDNGRCPMPYCGIGADGVIREVAGDPFADYKDFADCVRKNQDKDNPEAYCATIERKIKEARKKKDAEPRTEAERAMAHFNLSEEEWAALSEEEKAEKIATLPERESDEEDFKPTITDNLSMKKTIEEAKVYLKDVLSKLDSIEFVEDHLVEEEYQGNAGPVMTLSERAKMFNSISDDDWNALTEKEKEDYIAKLPKARPLEGETNKDEEDAGPRTEAERAMAHFNLSEEEWEKLSSEEKQEYIDKLPARGAGGETTDGECDGCDEDEQDGYDEYETWIIENIGKDAALTSSQKRGRPDSDYAFIEKGCKKVDGKTEQKCRHFLIYDAAHVRAALAALKGARTGKTPAFASQAKPKICAAAKKFKIESEVCGTTKKKGDKLDPDEVRATLRRTMADKDYPY